MVQEKARSSIKSFDIGKLTGRHPDSIRVGMPEPVDSRFEPINSNYEHVSKFKNTKTSTLFEGVTSRKELWGPSQPQPDCLNVEKTDKVYWLPKAAMPVFNQKVPGHGSPKRPFKVPDGYSYDSLKRGFEATTSHKRPAALVNVASSPLRDNSMYERLDPDYIKQVKKERRKGGKFELNDYLPKNILQQDRSSG